MQKSTDEHMERHYRHDDARGNGTPVGEMTGRGFAVESARSIRGRRLPSGLRYSDVREMGSATNIAMDELDADAKDC